MIVPHEGPGTWQSFLKRKDNIGLSIMEAKQKYLKEQLLFENYVSTLNTVNTVSTAAAGAAGGPAPSTGGGGGGESGFIYYFSSNNESGDSLAAYPLTEISGLDFNYTFGPQVYNIPTPIYGVLDEANQRTRRYIAFTRYWSGAKPSGDDETIRWRALMGTTQGVSGPEQYYDFRTLTNSEIQQKWEAWADAYSLVSPKYEDGSPTTLSSPVGAYSYPYGKGGVAVDVIVPTGTTRTEAAALYGLN